MLRAMSRPAALVLVVAAALSALGCGNPCVDLQEICDVCNDPDQKASCEGFVDRDVADACDSNIDNFNKICE